MNDERDPLDAYDVLRLVSLTGTRCSAYDGRRVWREWTAVVEGA